MTKHSHVVYFAHGKESGPWGTKIVRMAEIAKRKGCGVESPDYSATMDPDQRVRQLLELKPPAGENLIMVGSSMGGYVSTVASAVLRPGGLFLLAPAFYRNGYAHQNPKPNAAVTWIVHGWQDEIIPVENSLRFAEEFKVNMHVLDGDHRLIDALPQIEKLFEVFLDQVLTIEA